MGAALLKPTLKLTVCAVVLCGATLRRVDSALFALEGDAAENQQEAELKPWQKNFSARYVYLGAMASGISLLPNSEARKATGEGGPEIESVGKWVFVKPNHIRIRWHKIMETTYKNGKEQKINKKGFEEFYSFNSDFTCLVPKKISAQVAEERANEDRQLMGGGVEGRQPWGVLCVRN